MKKYLLSNLLLLMLLGTSVVFAQQQGTVQTKETPKSAENTSNANQGNKPGKDQVFINVNDAIVKPEIDNKPDKTEDPKSVAAAASGSVQMENDGLRKQGTTILPLRFYHNISGSPAQRFYENGFVELRTTSGQLFGLGVNESGQIEFVANGTTTFGTSNTAMTIDDGSGRFVGIGTTSPSAKLEVAGLANEEIRISKVGSGFGSTRLGFFSDKGSANEWRPGYIASGDNGTFTGRLDFFTNGTGSGAKLGNVLAMSAVNGRVGVGGFANNTTPDFPLHVTSTSSMFNSTSGAMAIGQTAGYHLNFDNNEINAWNGTAGSTLYLNYFSNAKVQVGNGTSGNLDVNGFSNLGDGAPAIKMKKLTGTTDADSFTSFPHGLTKSKILSVTVLINTTTDLALGNFYPDHINTAGSTEYRYYVTGSDVNLANVGTSLQGKPYVILITYEQ